jgi:hypothetical protein
VKRKHSLPTISIVFGGVKSGWIDILRSATISPQFRFGIFSFHDVIWRNLKCAEWEWQHLREFWTIFNNFASWDWIQAFPFTTHWRCPDLGCFNPPIRIWLSALHQLCVLNELFFRNQHLTFKKRNESIVQYWSRVTTLELLRTITEAQRSSEWQIVRALPNESQIHRFANCCC